MTWAWFSAVAMRLSRYCQSFRLTLQERHIQLMYNSSFWAGNEVEVTEMSCSVRTLKSSFWVCIKIKYYYFRFCLIWPTIFTIFFFQKLYIYFRATLSSILRYCSWHSSWLWWQCWLQGIQLRSAACKANIIPLIPV